MIVAVAAAVGAAVAMAMALLRLFAGPTLYDRLLAANAAGWKAALVCAALAVAAAQPAWLDAAIALLLAIYVTNAAVLKFFRARTFQAPMVREQG
jgi:multicomponent Na+:H+ antiporter subunit F